MAKLENVKILDMVNGEPTRVEYNGAIYEKVGDEAVEGDLVLVTDADFIGDVEQGEFYKIYTDSDGDLVFDDEDDWARDYSCNEAGLKTFRKVSETKASADLAERLAELERRLEALEERAGAKESELKVGDYAKIIDASKGHLLGFKDGDVVEITGSGFRHDFRVEKNEGLNIGFTDATNLAKVSDEEVAQAKEEARWAKIGRKPGEFKKGDIVRVLKDNPHGSEKRKGDIDEITYYDNNESFCVGESAGWMGYEDVELIVPVEQRFDLAVEPKVGARQ
jgi:cupin superfamily acireductone dioxygenase involved in methionine salvage